MWPICPGRKWCGVCFLSDTCSWIPLYGCRRSLFGGRAELNKCALYLCVQCLGASALCPEVCTKIIFSKSLISFKGRHERDGKIIVHIWCVVYIGGGRRGVYCWYEKWYLPILLRLCTFSHYVSENCGLSVHLCVNYIEKRHPIVSLWD